MLEEMRDVRSEVMSDKIAYTANGHTRTLRAPLWIRVLRACVAVVRWVVG